MRAALLLHGAAFLRLVEIQYHICQTSSCETFGSSSLQYRPRMTLNLVFRCRQFDRENEDNPRSCVESPKQPKFEIQGQMT